MPKKNWFEKFMAELFNDNDNDRDLTQTLDGNTENNLNIQEFEKRDTISAEEKTEREQMKASKLEINLLNTKIQQPPKEESTMPRNHPKHHYPIFFTEVYLRAQQQKTHEGKITAQQLQQKEDQERNKVFVEFEKEQKIAALQQEEIREREKLLAELKDTATKLTSDITKDRISIRNSVLVNTRKSRQQKNEQDPEQDPQKSTNQSETEQENNTQGFFIVNPKIPTKESTNDNTQKTTSAQGGSWWDWIPSVPKPW